MAVSGTISSSRIEVAARLPVVRNGMLCALAVMACIWATHPVAEMGIQDDWCYARTALIFAQTGHLTYNGWGGAILGWQAAWGALFIKLFGFSFTVVRLSILPIVIATILLFHSVLVRFGINLRNATLGTLTLGLSPMFMPVATTYMTDVPAVFVVLLCLYLCQRAVAANTNKATIAWLCLATVANLAGGTVRQTVWLGALVMAPSTGWFLRKRKGVLLASLMLLIFSSAAIFVCMRWLSRQPYVIDLPLFKGSPVDRAVPFARFFFGMLGLSLCLPVIVLPILIAWLPSVRKLGRAAQLRIFFVTVIWAVFERVSKWTMPWLTGVIDAEFGVGHVNFELRSFSAPLWPREMVSLLAIAATLVLIEYIWGRVGSLVKNNPSQLASWREMWWLVGAFSLSYFALLMPVAYKVFVYDRYALLLAPIAVLIVLKLHQELIAPTLPILSVVVLLFFALLALTGTHDWFAWSKARLIAINQIRASGVPRSEIQGGLEYDGWTEYEEIGYLNNPLIKNPAGAYHRVAPQSLPDACQYKFASYTPAIHPKYTTVFPPMWCLEPSMFPPVNYRTWLPPFHGTIYVQKIPESSN